VWLLRARSSTISYGDSTPPSCILAIDAPVASPSMVATEPARATCSTWSPRPNGAPSFAYKSSTNPALSRKPSSRPRRNAPASYSSTISTPSSAKTAPTRAPSSSSSASSSTNWPRRPGRRERYP
ncbi:hypothetical protein BN1723_004078, partial [Verticillium longisporum]